MLRDGCVRRGHAIPREPLGRSRRAAWGSALLVSLMMLGAGWGDALAQWTTSRYEVRTLEVFEDWHWVPDPIQAEVGNLRQIIGNNRLAGNPAGNVGPLIRMTEINPHDYFAWEFLSYTYAVLGDAKSAANVDLRTVALFEFVPAASPQVSRAAARLNAWDPYSWRDRIAKIRSGGFLPVIPADCYDRYIQARGVFVHEIRSIAYHQIEESLNSFDSRMSFLREWRE